MKQSLTILAIVFMGLMSCKKENNGKDEYWFLIAVTNPSNADCKLPEITFVENKQQACTIIGNCADVYVAAGLPKVLYAVGNKMYVQIKKQDLPMPCTTMGPALPQVYITAIR
jgi:hypothetical protein